MLTQSYLIFSPAGPADIRQAEMTQRQSVPLAWAFAVASPKATFKHEGGQYYFETRVGDALAVIDRATAAWNYNSYFRDTLAPIGVFRTWLANHSPDTWLYLNITELIERSPTPTNDVMQMKRLSEIVDGVLIEVESKNFTQFIAELRKLSFPFITVPITGDRRVDQQILSFEMRDTSTIESEMALQLVGVDRDQSLLRRAAESIRFHKEGAVQTTPPPEADVAVAPARRGLVLHTSDMEQARELLVRELGCTVLRDSPEHLVLDAHGHEFMISRISSREG